MSQEAHVPHITLHMSQITPHESQIPHITSSDYGAATCSRLLKIIGLFCKRALWKRRYSAKETCNFKDPINRSHPMASHSYESTHRGDQTSNTRISRSHDFAVWFFEWRELRLHTWKCEWKFGDSRENVFDMYGDSRENLFTKLAVVIILSVIAPPCVACRR